jgi:hypothetical protein
MVLFDSLKQSFPDRILGSSVVGHCMYGCSSCKGNEHRLPIYFTRYFAGKIPYDKKFILQKYSKNNFEKNILVCPSTGETSLILNMDMLELFRDLQNSGKYNFIFKLHPTCFHLEDYDLEYPPSLLEFNNLKFIHKTFTVTSEEEPCLLPFFEAFETIICDLHSTVGFIAQYFSPRIIIAYHNDAYYEVPHRDERFLANLSIFDEINGLRRFLCEAIPEKKGNSDFF